MKVILMKFIIIKIFKLSLFYFKGTLFSLHGNLEFGGTPF